MKVNTMREVIFGLLVVSFMKWLH